MKSGLPNNPFRVQTLGPFGCEYRFRDESQKAAILAALRGAGWNGELVAPHGAGKSTLLTLIGEHLRREERLRVVRCRCNSEKPSLPASWPLLLARHDVVLIDGAEVLNRGALKFVLLCGRMLKKGMILTTHQRLHHGAFIPVSPDPAVFERMVAERMAGLGESLRSPLAETINVSGLLAECEGNTREAFSILYGLCEDAHGRCNPRPRDTA